MGQLSLRRRFGAPMLVCVVAVWLVAAVPARAATPAAVSTATDGQAESARALLRYVPESVRFTCRLLDPGSQSGVRSSFASHIDVELVCSGGDAADAVYYDKISDGALDAAFDAYIASPLTTPDGDCDKQGTYQDGGKTVGRWACYKVDPAQVAPTAGAGHAVELNWTDTRSGILVQAIRRDGDSSALNDWWDTTDAGPLSTPTSTGVPPALSAGQQQTAQQRLLSHIPSSVRKTCTADSLVDERSLGETLYPWRVWLTASVTCAGGSGVDFVGYESFANAGSMTAHLHQYAIVSDPQTGSDADCEASGTYKIRGKSAGEYQCTFYGVSSPASQVAPNGAVFQWTYKPGLVGAEIANHDGDPAPLYKWWDNVGSNI